MSIHQHLARCIWSAKDARSASFRTAGNQIKTFSHRLILATVVAPISHPTRASAAAATTKGGTRIESASQTLCCPHPTASQQTGRHRREPTASLGAVTNTARCARAVACQQGLPQQTALAVAARGAQLAFSGDCFPARAGGFASGRWHAGTASRVVSTRGPRAQTAAQTGSVCSPANLVLGHGVLSGGTNPPCPGWRETALRAAAGGCAATREGH